MWQECLHSKVVTNSVSELHDAVGHEVSEAPRLVLSHLVDEGHDVVVHFLRRKYLREANTAVDSLHPHRILLIFEKFVKDVE